MRTISITFCSLDHLVSARNELFSFDLYVPKSTGNRNYYAPRGIHHDLTSRRFLFPAIDNVLSWKIDERISAPIVITPTDDKPRNVFAR